MSAVPPSPDPAQGPRILFFSGGSALRGVSRLLPSWTHRSVHLITPFDSGGSSAALREALGMPAVGDLRNRILALAEVASPEGRARHDLLAHRLDDRASLRGLTPGLPSDVGLHLATCLDALTHTFDFRHASVGNLVMAGIWLAQGRSLSRAAAVFSDLVGARGTVRPVSEDHLHLAAELADGSVVVGQHRITRLAAEPIARVFLVRSLEDPTPARTRAPDEVLDLVGSADLVCFGVGSFFTSVLASLLPSGIGAAVAASPAPKAYLPNAGGDPEERGWSLDDRVRVLARLLAPLDAADIAVLGPLVRSAEDPSRYDDAAVLGALRGACRESPAARVGP